MTHTPRRRRRPADARAADLGESELVGGWVCARGADTGLAGFRVEYSGRSLPLALGPSSARSVFLNSGDFHRSRNSRRAFSWNFVRPLYDDNVDHFPEEIK